jgi:antitoxin CcdA
MLRFENGPKKATNLSLNASLLEAATEMGINISQTVDELLANEVKRQYWQKWNEENKEAIDHYNARIESEGLPLAQYRTF